MFLFDLFICMHPLSFRAKLTLISYFLFIIFLLIVCSSVEIVVMCLQSAEGKKKGQESQSEWKELQWANNDGRTRPGATQVSSSEVAQ